MPGPVSAENVLAAALRGMVDAQKCYEEICSAWLTEAPEYYATVRVAERIAKLDGAKFVSLEHSAKGAIVEAGAIGRGKLKNAMRPNGRFDILLWWGNGTPRAPIEVKIGVTSIDKIHADIIRIQKVVHHQKNKSTIGFGVVAFYSYARSTKSLTAKQKLEAMYINVAKSAKEIVGENCDTCFKSSKIYEDDGEAWRAGVLLIKPRNV